MLTFLADLTPAAAVFLSVGVVFSGFVPVLLLAEARLTDFDPRPAVRRTAEAVHQAAVHAGHDVNRAIARLQLAALQLRDRTRLALYDALLAALHHLAPKGTTR